MVLQSLLPVSLVTTPYTAEQLATTPYTAIQLTFQAQAPYAPDGDSVRMMARNSNLWPSGVNRSAKDGTVQSRMEGIDAHELHFYGYAQRVKWATDERDHLLKLLRIPKDSPKVGVPGWALTRSADLYGRCVAFLFPQEALLVDGAKYMTGDVSFLDLVQQSANFKMLSDGLAYPLFYEYLAEPVLRLMQQLVEKAKKEKRGFWPEDQTMMGAQFLKTDDAEEAIFYPKIFRRLIRYFDTLKPHVGLNRFREFLELDPDLLHLASESREKVRRFHDRDILEIDTAANRLRLLVPPEQLVFHERTEENPKLPLDQ